MTFAEAVTAAPELRGALKRGLQALGTNRTKITLKKASLCGGSVDIDSHLRVLYPQESRWDYAFGYIDSAYFVEVHPASTHETKTVVAKYRWLREWVRDKAPTFNSMPKRFFWIATKGVLILKNSPQYRLLAKEGLLPITHLSL